jgi:tetratricopeptide (TPR) repeat protein
MVKPKVALLLALVAIAGSPIGLTTYPAYAQSSNQTVVAPTGEQLDLLFLRLKKTQNAFEASVLTSQIWQQWMTPTDPDLSDLMDSAVSAARVANTSRAFEILDHVTTTYPEYAAGWNLRATLHFETKNYEQSLLDIEETLKREPRHFGALSGQALIYLSQGQRDKARASILAAQRIHPFIATNPPFDDLIGDLLQV